MTRLADLYPAFESHYVDTPAGRVFTRVGGSGPPLLLLHGFPQTHVMWHRVAPELAASHRLIIPDLPGYGWSAAPAPGRAHFPYAKRAMAEAMVALMEHFGHVHFAVAGHDRGARVGYRLALDAPGRVERLAVLDIIPTLAMWHGMDRARALQVYHWSFLAQPHPFPEHLIGADPTYFLDWTMADWTATRDLSVFDPRALSHYRAAFSSPDHIRAACEDYRAGATTDLSHDEADLAAGRQIDCALLALWGASGIPSRGASPLEAWAVFAPKRSGAPIEGGHFICEEAPDAVSAALKAFFAP